MPGTAAVTFDTPDVARKAVQMFSGTRIIIRGAPLTFIRQGTFGIGCPGRIRSRDGVPVNTSYK